MLFEYDAEKSQINKEKHGIDFEEAQEIWNDAKATQKKTAYQAEERFIQIGAIGNKIWAAVFTYRGETVRLISVRRAHEDERKQYEAE
jgi:uncharacterized DUF497 family protein